MTKEFKTVCPRDCPDSCFMRVLVSDGKIRQVTGERHHPVTRGILCPRGIADLKRVDSKQRVLFPRVRDVNKPGNHFDTVSMDEALNFVAFKLQQTIDKHGAESVLLLDYVGNCGLFSLSFPQRLWHAIGATKTDYAICSNSGHTALGFHYGLSYGIQPETLLNKKVIIFWGFNAKVSSLHQWHLATQARKDNNAVIVAIDPRKSETAASADIWLQPHPGSDVALAYALANILIENQLIDDDFIRKQTTGFDAFYEEAKKWQSDKTENVTGVPKTDIEKLGQLLGRHKNCAFMIGLGFQKSYHGAESVRAVSLLPALLGQHRGFYYANSKGRFIDWDYLTGETLAKQKSKIVSQVALGNRLKAGEFKFVYINGMNPAVTLPHQKAVREGFAHPDTFVVVHDTHWTETTHYADVVLPAATYFEKEDIVIPDGHLYVRYSPKIIEPQGQSKSEPWIMQHLIDKLGLSEKWLQETPVEVAFKAMKDSFEDGTIEDLVAGVPLRLKQKPTHEYQTPSGKIEFCSNYAFEQGFSPLPQQLINEIEHDEFIYLNSAVLNYTHTQFQDVYGEIPCQVWINIADAQRNNIKEGDHVQLQNSLGTIEVIAVVTDKVPTGVLWSPKLLTGLNGSPQNEIMSAQAQTIGNGPVFNSTRVKIRKVG